MRKADYTALAAIIKRKTQYYRSMHTNALTPARRNYAEGLLGATLAIAGEFSRVASVDAGAFLEACGIADSHESPTAR